MKVKLDLYIFYMLDIYFTSSTGADSHNMTDLRQESWIEVYVLYSVHRMAE